MKITILDENNSFNKDEKKNIRSTVLKTLKLLDQLKELEEIEQSMDKSILGLDLS